MIELKNELKSKNIELNDLYEDNKKLSNRIDVELSEIKVTYQLKTKELERKTFELENYRIENENLK